MPKYTHQRSMGGVEPMGIIRRCTSHGGVCVGVEGTSQKHISTKQKRIRVSLYAYTPVCRLILVPKIIQRKEHMSYTCWCLQFGSSIKHTKASGCACLVSITEQYVPGRWPTPATWAKGR